MSTITIPLPDEDLALLHGFADALEIVLNVTTTDLAGTGFPQRQAATHTSAPPDAPQNVRLQATGLPAS